jgi:TetR/AcrR family acrAB operon transcriptional repressor
MARNERIPNAEREQRILDAAADLTLRYGFDKTTVSDIASAAGVSKGAIYLHYESKEALFDALVLRETNRYTKATIRVLEKEPPENWSFITMYSITLALLPNYPLIEALLRDDQAIYGSFLQRSRLPLMEMKRQSRLPLLRQMQAVGAFRQDLDIEAASYLIDMLGYGFVMIEDIIPADEAPPLDRVLTTMADMLEQFLMPADGGNREAGRKVMMQVIRQFQQQYLENTANEKEAQHHDSD